MLAHRVPDAFVAAIRAHGPELDVRQSLAEGDVADIHSVLVWGDAPDMLRNRPSLRLVLSLGAGVDKLIVSGLVPDGVMIGRTFNEIQAEGIDDYVMLHVPRNHRRLDALRGEQARHVWQWRLWPRASETTIGVLGLGRLGSEVARRLAIMGFQVPGWSRTVKVLEDIETFAGAGELDAFLERCDQLVCLLPLTPETDSILGPRLFARLPRGAFIINAGRGDHLDEAALIEALDSGQIAGATLDVLRQEPPAADHPFFDHQGIVLTPHFAACSTPEQLGPGAVEDCRRAERHQQPRFPVDRAVGC